MTNTSIPGWNKLRGDTLIKALLWLEYGAIVAVGLWHHEPYNDEAEAWIVAREATAHDFVRVFAYAGHPPLWYALLFPFARLGLPFETVAVINGIIAMITALLIVFRAPFPLWLKALFLFSVGMAYEYAVLQRGYMLMILIFCLIAVCYPTRLEKPKRYAALLALSFNTEAFAIIPTAVLAVFFTLEGMFRAGNWRYYTVAIIIVAAGAISCLAALWPPTDIQPGYAGFHYRYPGMFMRQVSIGFLSDLRPSDIVPPLPEMLTPVARMALYYLGAALLSLTALYLGMTRWAFFFTAWLAWFWFIMTIKFPGYPRHAELIPVFAFWTLWLSQTSTSDRKGRFHQIVGNALMGGLAFSFFLGDCQAYREYGFDYRLPYSGGKGMAAFIQSSGYDKKLIVSLACHRTAAVSVYLPTTDFWLAGLNRHARYPLWNRSIGSCIRKMNHVYGQELAQMANEDEALLLSTAPLSPSPNVALHMLYKAPGKFWPYFLYSYRLMPTGG